APDSTEMNEVRAVIPKQPPHHDMAALDQAKPARRRPKQHSLFHQADPRSGGVDQNARARGIAPATHLQYKLPGLAAVSAHTACARADHGTAFGRIERIEHDQTRIVA